MARVGLAGFGFAGKRFHRPLVLAAGMTVTAVVTSNSEAALALLPSAAVVPTVEDLAARNDVDVVVVATPSDLHYAHARVALLHKKHVVVDKPFAGKKQQ